MAGDVHYPKVQLMLQGLSFKDWSYNDAAIDHGALTLTSTLPGVLSSSYWFHKDLSGTPFSIDHADNAAINANIDFSLEINAFCQRNPFGCVLFSNRSASGTGNGLFVGLDSLGKAFVRLVHNGVLVLAIDGNSVVANNALRLIKVHRKLGVWGLMIDGVPQYDLGHQPIYNGAIQHGDKFYLGADPYADSMFLGGVNQVRLTVGEARQTTAYVPSIEPWPLYATDPNILFGSLSTDITTVGAAVSILLTIENAAAVSVAAVNAVSGGVGSGWAIVPFASAGDNYYRITGTAPSANADYTLVVTGTTDELNGELSRTQSYHIYNTLAGTLSAMQNLLAQIGGARLWLDGADSTTINATGSNVNSILSKIDSMPFTAAASRPKPVIDTTSMNQNSIRFISNASSGLVPAAPVVLTGVDSGSTVLLGGKYVGTQTGQGAGLFQISYTDDDAREDGTASWILSTTETGTDNASASMYDSSARQNGIGTDPLIEPGDTFVISWHTASNTADIWINQQLVAEETELAGTLGFWSAVSAAIGFIGGSQSPTGAFIAMNTLIAIDKDLIESHREALISLINHDLAAFTPIPFSSLLSTLQGYVGNPFVATTVLTDTTSVEIEGSAGTDWEIFPSGSSNPNEYTITGTLPSTAGELTLTLTMSNNGVPGEDAYTVEVLALPTTPTIDTPLNLYAQRNASFASLVNIYSADTVSIVGSAGSAWAITLAPENDSGNYLITGQVPDNLGTMQLTITANKVDEETELTVQAVRQFNLLIGPSLVPEPDQYQVDLTGLLAANKITDEAQTLTSANGVKHQLLVPLFAPFFGDSFKLKYYNAAGVKVEAVENVDYVCAMEQGDMSRLCASKLYSAIVVHNPRLRGSMFLTYQTLGGSFGVDRRAMIEELARVSHSARYVAWDALTGKPVYFPVDDHYVRVHTEMIGLAGVEDSLESLRAALGSIVEEDVVALAGHASNTNNPHGDTKAHIGLPLVQNHQLASTLEATTGTSAQRYVTPKTAIAAIDAALPAAADTVTGKHRLNLGTQPGDDTDSTKPLTGLGVVNLLVTPVPNALNALFDSTINQAEQPVQATPFPLVFPLFWKGLRCVNAAELAGAVRSYSGIKSLRFDQTTGVFYFPVDVTPPELVTTQSYVGTGYENATVDTAVSLPIVMTD